MLATFGVGQVLLSMFYFFIFILWIMLLFHIFADIFRSHDMGGGAKALWIIFVIFMPFLGVFVYLIARGGKMAEHAAADAKAQDDAMRQYIQSTAGTTSSADELKKLADLKAAGTISDAEFEAAKAKILS
jgi:hypothetical protein